MTLPSVVEELAFEVLTIVALACCSALMIALSEVTNWGSTKLGLVGVDILVYGLVLLLVVLWAPKGIVGMLSRRGTKGRRQ